MAKLTDIPKLLDSSGRILVYDPAESNPIPAKLWDFLVRYGAQDHEIEDIGHGLMHRARQESGPDASLSDISSKAISLAF